MVQIKLIVQRKSKVQTGSDLQSFCYSDLHKHEFIKYMFYTFSFTSD